MARILDEKLEGTGYQNTWTESVGAGCTINEDAASSDVGSPTDWGSQCLKLITAVGVPNYTYSLLGDGAIRYTRVEIVITARTLDDGTGRLIAVGMNNAGSTYCWRLFIARSGASYLFAVIAFLDGTTQSLYWGSAYSLNTKYRLEIRWDKTNNVFDWKVDGTSQGSQSLVAGSVQMGLICAGGDDNPGNNSATFYEDLIAVDNADWVGAEVSAGQPLVKRFAGVPFQRLNKGVW
jgi:hypothetical protein